MTDVAGMVPFEYTTLKPAPAYADAWKPVESRPACVSVENNASVGAFFDVLVLTYLYS